MDVREALSWGINELKNINVSEPKKSAEFLLRQVLDWDKARLIANPEYEINENQEKKFRKYIERRKKHEPVWYITGKIEFYGLNLEVNENVLIPRPETEFLVEEVISATSVILTKEESQSDPSLSLEDDDIRILELGTGSGAISLALANKFRPEDDQPLAEKTKIFASDISEDALRVAKKNAKRLGFTPCSVIPAEAGIQTSKKPTIDFRKGDLLEPWKDMKFDIIVANLPYIPHEDMSSLALDIHHWEPRIALDGGKDGLDIYEKLISQAKDYLNKGAMMFFEIGIDQGDKIKALVKQYLPNARVKIIKDYGDIDRIAIISNIGKFY